MVVVVVVGSLEEESVLNSCCNVLLGDNERDLVEFEMEFKKELASRAGDEVEEDALSKMGLLVVVAEESVRIVELLFLEPVVVVGEAFILGSYIYIYKYK